MKLFQWLLCFRDLLHSFGLLWIQSWRTSNYWKLWCKWKYESHWSCKFLNFYCFISHFIKSFLGPARFFQWCYNLWIKQWATQWVNRTQCSFYLKKKKLQKTFFAVYFEIDDNDSITVEFKTKDTSTAKWDVMASQIECSSIYRFDLNILKILHSNSHLCFDDLGPLMVVCNIILVTVELWAHLIGGQVVNI